MKFLMPSIFLMLILLSSCNYFASWQTKAQDDLTEIVKQFTDNHPGIVNIDDPQFAQRMNGRYEEALSRLSIVKTEAGYQALLKWFMNGFQDKHAQISFKNDIKTFFWPGFIVSYQNNNFVVSYAHEPWPAELPAIGSKLIECDTRQPIDYINDCVLPYNNGINSLEADYVRLSGKLFIDDGNPWFKRTTQCTFKYNDQEGKYSLSWQEISSCAYNKITHKVFKQPQRNFALEKLSDSGVWISIPTLWPNDNQVPLLKKIIEQVPSIREKRYIVLDMRGCHGGTSTWGYDLLKAIYGKDYINALASESSYQDWRVSQGNLERVQWLIERERRQNGSNIEYFLDIEKQMKDALGKGENFVHWKSNSQATPTPNSPMPLPQTEAKVFFLTDYACFSACLSVADFALTIPGVTHIGLPTNADTLYEPVREINLPSGAEVYMPICIQRNRKRQPNKPYIPLPAYRFDGNINGTAELKQWVLGIVNKGQAQ